MAPRPDLRKAIKYARQYFFRPDGQSLRRAILRPAGAAVDCSRSAKWNLRRIRSFDDGCADLPWLTLSAAEARNTLSDHHSSSCYSGWQSSAIRSRPVSCAAAAVELKMVSAAGQKPGRDSVSPAL